MDGNCKNSSAVESEIDSDSNDLICDSTKNPPNISQNENPYRSDDAHVDEFISTPVIPQPNMLNLSSVAISNSSDITLGNRAYYNGPVTINHYSYTDQQSKNVINIEGNFTEIYDN